MYTEFKIVVVLKPDAVDLHEITEHELFSHSLVQLLVIHSGLGLLQIKTFVCLTLLLYVLNINILQGRTLLAKQLGHSSTLAPIWPKPAEPTSL